MNTPQPSATAIIMAFHRALEMLFPEAERVCRDPLAVKFLPPDWAGVLEDRDRLTALMGEKAQQFPGVNGAIVSRVRFIDDVVKQALSDGMRQLVIIGAGYDSRAYRMDGIGGRVTVFELDDPATQQDKRGKLEAAIGAPLDHVRYIAMDVGRDSIKERLADNGYDADKKSLFILEGLVPYISAEALAGLLGFIAAGRRHAVVFDYLPPSVVDGTCRWVEGRNMHREVLSHGEAFRLGFSHDELDRLLRDRGFDVVENVNAPDLKTRYFHGASARRPVTPVFWFAHAVASGST
ncbi:SAM-dependent methyltransferase [Desulfosarcina alkanivorans]|uniref:S-adenosyl-L-methionine-dependent methyltransferase n=1 Tax=Desulfosarcina alkanivorans TaxID=571177 RepID=A0A5K7YRD8_9BACT|nr:class I SAM-dependent methyltransferase [Desulfosarcina alkanivorans]BBO70833.1 SAM-dependent methyltransferase [Desulfosarcina alkanivorans]